MNATSLTAPLSAARPFRGNTPALGTIADSVTFAGVVVALWARAQVAIERGDPERGHPAAIAQRDVEFGIAIHAGAVPTMALRGATGKSRRPAGSRAPRLRGDE